MKTIKVPTPRQLPSGNWFIQLSVNGQRISVTEPTEKACIARALAVKQELLAPVDRSHKITLSAAIDQYIVERENILSPSTIKGYRTIQKHRFQQAMARPINAYTEQGWQKLVNQEAKTVSAKTLQNAWRFVSSVLHDQIGERYNVSLPMVISDQRLFLEPEQIPVFVAAVSETKYAIPALLALCSLRRSDILALKWDNIDLKRNVVHVRGAVVPDESGQMVFKKENKNRSSRRSVPIMIPELVQALQNAAHTEEQVVTMHPSAILNGINRVCKKNALPPVGIHGLRHSFASLAYHLGMPEKVAMQIGGWENDATMKKIYTHAAKSDILKYENIMAEYFISNSVSKTG